MNKLLKNLFLLALVTLFFVLPKTVYSQGSTAFDKAFERYSLDAESYRQARVEYTLARSQYLKFQTLTSLNTAKEKTAAMLTSRDALVISYILVLKERIDETQGIPDATRDAIKIRLDDEIVWYSEHKGKITSAGSLDDLIADNNTAKSRYEVDDPLLYEAISIVASGRVSQYRDRLKNTFSSVSDKVTQIREENRQDYTFTTKKLETIDRWIFDTDNRISRSSDKQTEADSLISDFISLKTKGVSNYGKVLGLLGESQQYLKEASLFVKEIIREIKTQD